MILGAFTVFHVVLSLVGIGAGFVVVRGLLASKSSEGWTQLFLATTAATSVTGFLFPVHQFMPSHGVGILSLIALTIAVLARYRFGLAHGWRRTYVVTAIIALYFNVFVLIVQLFMKVPPLQAIAPTQSEPPFLMAQLAVLLLFAFLGIRAAIKFRSEPPRHGATVR
jgi:hypothetical protein